MRRFPLILLATFAAFLLPLAGASASVQTEGLIRDEADCAAIPCGPIPVIVTMQLGETRGLVFPDDGVLTLEGELVYYFDVDNDGYGHDETSKPVVTFSTPRGVPWVTVAVEPAEIEIPVDDPQYISETDPDNPGQYHYEYRHPITVTLTKDATPTADELNDHLRSGDQYRILVAAQSTGSQVNAGGTTYGHMEGYGVKDLRVTPTDEELSSTSGAQGDAGGDSPGLGAIVSLVGLGLALAVVAHRTRF